MELLNEQLCLLQQKVARKHQLKARIDGLRSQRSGLYDKVTDLKKRAIAEEADVTRLEGRSLAAFFYNVVGQMDKKLDQERREPYAARVKYDAAARELEAVEQDLADCSAELAGLALCEDHYRMCLEEKAAAIKASDCAAGLEILRLETVVQTLECQIRELCEAIDAGKTALFTTNNIQSTLESAESWGTWDLLGGGFLTDVCKHDALDNGQAMIEELQIQLRRFWTELTDVRIDAEIQLSIDGFDRFADFFFDGLFADWAVMDRIGQARIQLGRTRNQIETVLKNLENMLAMTRSELASCRAALDGHIMNA